MGGGVIPLVFIAVCWESTHMVFRQVQGYISFRQLFSIVFDDLITFIKVITLLGEVKCFWVDEGMVRGLSLGQSLKRALTRRQFILFHVHSLTKLN